MSDIDCNYGGGIFGYGGNTWIWIIIGIIILCCLCGDDIFGGRRCC